MLVELLEHPIPWVIISKDKMKSSSSCSDARPEV